MQYSMPPMTSRSPAETPESSRPAKRGASSFGWWMDAAAVALFAAVVLGLMLLSFHSPLYADDYNHLVAIRDHPFLGDYLMHWYTGWSGNLTILTLIYVALRYQLLWGIANGAAFVALVVLTFAVAMGRRPRMVRRDMQILAVVLAAYWFALPAIGETVFWRVGSSYLWATWLMLLFVFPYRRWMSSPAVSAHLGRVRRAAASLGWLAFGFVVGCANLQVVAALCALFVVFAVKVWQRGLRTVPVALVAGVVGAALGAAALVLAPGNEVRLAAAGTLSLTVFERAHGLAGYLASILIHWLPPLIPWLLCLLVVAVPMRQVRQMGGGQRDAAAPPRAWWIWGLAGVATLAPFVITPGNGAERTVIFLAVFLMVSVLALAADGKRRALDCLPSAATSIVIAGLMLCVLAPMAGSVRRAMLLTEATHQREQLVRAQKARGVVDVVVPPIEGSLNRAVTFSDLTSDPGFWTNKAMADWYGVRTIVVSGEAKLP